MFGLPIDVTMSMLRQLLSIGGSVLVTKGLLSGDQVSAAVSAIVVLVSIAWSVLHHLLSNNTQKDEATVTQVAVS